MKINKKNYSKPSSFYYLISILLLISGYAFYIFVRGFDPVFGAEISSPLWSSLPEYIWNSYASFIHVLALSLFSYALLGVRSKYKIAIMTFWITVNVGFELLQFHGLSLGLNGTFDIADIYAVFLAGTLFYFLTTYVDSKFKLVPNTTITSKTYSRISIALVSVFGMISIMASSDGNGVVYYRDPPPPSTSDEPVYMTYEELRAPLKVDANRKLVKSGKIYIFQNLLIVSEPNIGIHIYDNSKPAQPIHKSFINLPGNLDIAVRSGYLYADSFIDLVVIDINDLNNIVEIHRVKSVFPYDAYQAIAANNRTFYRWDKTKGVIVGVKTTTSTSNR